MALKITRRAPGWDGAIQGGNTVTLRLPIGLTYHQVFTEYAFQDANPSALALAAAVDEIRVVANGKPIWNIKASELDKLNQFDGRAAANGVLTIDFDRFNLRNRLAEEFTSLGTGVKEDSTPLTTLVLEMDLKAAVASGSLSSRLRQSESRVLGMIKKVRRYISNFGGAGTYEIDDFPKGELINRIAFFESANDIDHLVIERDNFAVFDRSKELNAVIQTDGMRTPQANLFVFDTSEDGNGTDQLVTAGVNDLRNKLTVDGAMEVISIVEYLGGLER